jgi:hypothetical protein
VRLLAAFLLLITFLGSTSSAVAEVPPEVQMAAEAAFREGTELFAQGRHQEALARFEASERMDPGPGKRFNIAMCHARLHHPATAWVLFRDAAVEFEHGGAPDRAALARARAAELEPTLPRLRIRILQPVANLRVTRNGVELPVDAWNIDVPLDPGPCEVHASAPGFAEWTGRVEIPDQAFAAELVVPPLQPLPAPPAPPAPASTGAQGLARWPGWAALGVAAIGAGLGAYEGTTANARWNEAKPMCHGSGGVTTCTSQGASLARSANGYATVATVTFAVSGIALAGGVAWLVLGPSQKGATMGVQARF